VFVEVNKEGARKNSNGSFAKKTGRTNRGVASRQREMRVGMLVADIFEGWGGRAVTGNCARPGTWDEGSRRTRRSLTAPLRLYGSSFYERGGCWNGRGP